MRAHAAALALAVVLVPGAAQAAEGDLERVRGCITAAAEIHHLPPAVLVILLDVEGGALGRVTRNANGTVDIGPMQVNQIWLPRIAAHWRASEAAARTALRDDFCANLEGGAWILRQAIDEAHGDFWAGVGLYHSHDPGYRSAYLRKVLKQALRLQDQAARTRITAQAGG